MNGAGVLVELAKALGLGKTSGAVYGQGNLDWGWMVDPVGTARSNLNGAGRDNVVMALKDLLGVTGARAAGWYGIGGGDTAFLVVDPACDEIAWDAKIEAPFDNAALVRIGIGAKVSSDPTISARCWLLGLGEDAGLGAGPYTPGSPALGPELSVLCLPSSPVLGLKELGVVAGSDGQKRLQLMDFANFVWPPVKADVAQLDPLALALFVLKTYVRWCASKDEPWALDLTDHLFVAFGSRSDGGYIAPRHQKANPVPPFPGLFDAEWPEVPGGDLSQPAAISGANVGAWLLSLAPDADLNGVDADAAATFLLQLVWYITGKQPDLSTGSRIVSVEGAHVLRLSGQDVVTLSAWSDGAWIDVLCSSPSEGVEWLWGEATWQTGREGVSLSFSSGGLSLQLPVGELGTVEVRYRIQEKRWEVHRNGVGLADTLGGLLKEHLMLPFDPLSGEPADWLSWILERVPEFELTSGDGTSTLTRSVTGEFTLSAEMKRPTGPIWSAESAGLSLRSAQLTLNVPSLSFATPPAFPPAGTLSLRGLLLPFDDSKGGTPLTAALLPDPGDTKAGIDLDLAWDGGFNNPRVQEGSKVIPVQEKLGPVELDSIRVGLNSAEPCLDIDFDLSLNLAGVWIQPEGLGVGLRLPVGDETLEDCLSPHLRGLGVAVEAAGIAASGMFVEHPTADGAIDYQGAAQLNFWGYHLDGVGAFSGDGLSDASMFLFAGVSAPLGGTPEFFLTGLAGGFGYNRELRLPKIAELQDHPFLRVLGGEISLSTLSENLSTWFPIARGSGWFAAGLTFRTYGVIEGAGVLSVQLGAHPQVGLIGMAGLDLSPLAKLELALVTVVDLGDDPSLYVAIGLTSKSELLFGLIQPHGQGAYKQWFDRGYAVLTIGGYDPDFSPPAPSAPSEAWPQADRIGFHAGWGPLSIDVDGYLAVLPREIQFGLRVEGSLDFGWVGLSAWIRAYSLVRWDPVYVDTRVSIGLSVWVDTAVWSDSWDLSLDMALWGPPFGGRFEIDLVVDTLVVKVGENRRGAPLPSVEDVLTEQLGLVVEGSTVKAITDDTGRGAFHLDVLTGGVLSDAPKEQAPSTLRVGPEFALRLDSALPAHECVWGDDKVEGRGASSLEIVPSERSGVLSTLKVSLRPFLFSTTTVNADAVRATARAAPFPTALFGAEGLSPSKGGQTIRLDRGLRLDATLDPAVLESPTCRATLSTEVGEAVDDLPLGAVADMEQAASGLRKAGPPLRRSWARVAHAEEEEARAPWGVAVLSHLAVPPLPDSAPRGLPSAVHPRAPRRPAPAPGARRAALAGLRLERVQAPPVALPQPAPVDRRVLQRTLGASSLETALLGGGLRLNAGEALLLGSTGAGLLRGEGAQSLRLLCLGSDDRALEDDVLSPGRFQRALPTGTRRILVQGLGTPDGRRTMALGSGFTANTPLVRLGERGWAGPGVVICRRDELARPFQAVPALRAAELLHGSTEIELDFSALSGALALLTRGGAADVRAFGAAVGSHASAATADAQLAVHTVVASRRWRLAVTLAPGVALLGVLVRPGDPAALLGRLRTGRPALEDPVASRVGWTDLKMERA